MYKVWLILNRGAVGASLLDKAKNKSEKHFFMFPEELSGSGPDQAPEVNDNDVNDLDSKQNELFTSRSDSMKKIIPILP